MNDVLIDDYEECGQMDDVASLIRANGYDKVMLDIMSAVNRMENKQ